MAVVCNLTDEEREALSAVLATDGMEYNDIGDSVFLSLKDKKLVSFGPLRGPGRIWFRIEATEEGRSA